MSLSVAALLARNVETYTARLGVSHPLFRAARSGELGPGAVASYLTNLRFLLAQRPRQLRAARARCLELGQAELAVHFGNGRDEPALCWLEPALSHLEAAFAVTANGKPSRHLSDLAHFLERVIAERPQLYLAYTLFAEHLCLLLGPLWRNALCDEYELLLDDSADHDQRLDLDAGRIAEGLREIDALSRGERATPYLDVLHAAMRHFELFCDELLDEHRGSQTAAVAAE
jgi:hypothetical protein